MRILFLILFTLSLISCFDKKTKPPVVDPPPTEVERRVCEWSDWTGVEQYNPETAVLVSTIYHRSCIDGGVQFHEFEVLHVTNDEREFVGEFENWKVGFNQSIDYFKL